MPRQTRHDGLLSLRRNYCGRTAAWRSAVRYDRRLRLEPLEERLALTVLTVNSLMDGPEDLRDATVTLRDALYAANGDVRVSPGGPSGRGADEIQFQAGLSGIITLSEGMLFLSSDLTITGPGASALTVAGDNLYHLFSVNEGGATNKTVLISGLNISGGATARGIFNAETLTVENCNISGHIDSDGGGIYNHALGALSVLNSTISGSSAGNRGGGIFNAGTLMVLNSTISGNSANEGGGILNSGALTVQNSTITGNQLMQTGLTVGISVAYGGEVALHNTIVADNFMPFNGTVYESDVGSAGVYSVKITGTYNLIGTGGSASVANGVNGNQVGVANPLLGPLANNGGPTKTHVLLAGSPALNTGNNAQAPGFSSFDQRGAPFLRVFNGTVDIGAFEVQPVSLVVDTNLDEADGNEGPGHLSLREAISRSNANAAADTITFDPGFFGTPRTISLGLGQLAIRDDLTITGPGAALLTVNGNNATRVFEVSDLGASVKTVSLSGLTISGGNAGASAGGGIRNEENLTVLNSAVSNNKSASMDGGGISNVGTLTIQNSTISANAASFGGAISNSGGLTIENSTISSNLTSFGGAGVFTAVGAMTVRSSTITRNHSDNNNSTGAPGGGIAVFSGVVTLHNTIVADNFRGGGDTTDDDVDGGLSGSSTNNLIGTGGSGGLTSTNGNQVGVANPGLGALAANGGPPRTHALLAGSPAIDAGDPIIVFNPAEFDQRGAPFVRVVNGDAALGARIDIGAFELQSTAASADFDGDADVDGTDFLPWQRGLGITAGAAHAQGNADGDGDVDAVDLGFWKAQFGGAPLAVAESAAHSGASTAAPAAMGGGRESFSPAASFAAAALFDGGSFFERESPTLSGRAAVATATGPPGRRATLVEPTLVARVRPDTAWIDWALSPSKGDGDEQGRMIGSDYSTEDDAASYRAGVDAAFHDLAPALVLSALE